MVALIGELDLPSSLPKILWAQFKKKCWWRSKKSTFVDYFQVLAHKATVQHNYDYYTFEESCLIIFILL